MNTRAELASIWRAAHAAAALNLGPSNRIHRLGVAFGGGRQVGEDGVGQRLAPRGAFPTSARRAGRRGCAGGAGFQRAARPVRRAITSPKVNSAGPSMEAKAEVWVNVLEMAMAKMVGGWSKFGNNNSLYAYETIMGDVPGATYWSTAGKTWREIAAFITENKDHQIVLSTYDVLPEHLVWRSAIGDDVLVPDHAYMLTRGASYADGLFGDPEKRGRPGWYYEIYNPWGISGIVMRHEILDKVIEWITVLP